jgi:hypothetical protein
MSSGPKTRKSTGPTSPRGIYTKSVRAPGVSLDMPDGEPVKKRVGGKIKKMAGGGQVPGRKSKGSGSMQPMPKPHEQHFRDQIRTPVIPDPVKYPSYIEEVGEERVSGPRMRKGGSVSSASKRADGCAVKGKTRGKMI